MTERYDSAWIAATKAVENDANLCIVPDIESGFPQVMTVRERQRLLDVYEACKPKLNNIMKNEGKIFFFGIGGSSDDGLDFKQMFVNNNEK